MHGSSTSGKGSKPFNNRVKPPSMSNFSPRSQATYGSSAHVPYISQYFRPVFDATSADGESTQARGCSAAVDDTSCPAATCASCDTDDCNVAAAVSKCKIFSYTTNKYGITWCTPRGE